jgi:hypothetical protein
VKVSALPSSVALAFPLLLNVELYRYAATIVAPAGISAEIWPESETLPKPSVDTP